MPSPKRHRKGSQEKNKKGRLSEKASSFHGRDAGAMDDMLPRPRTVPDFLAGRRAGGSPAEGAPSPPPKLTKLLVNVTIQRSPGPVQVLMPPEATVQDLITAALRQYVNEARRPVPPSTASSAFDLHYSQFSFESLDREVKIVELGSRNFFLCPRQIAAESGGASVASSCSKEAEEVTRKGCLGSSSWVFYCNSRLIVYSHNYLCHSMEHLVSKGCKYCQIIESAFLGIYRI